MSHDKHIAIRAAYAGIPLACAGDGEVDMIWTGGKVHPLVCAGCNVTLVAEPEAGMDAETFGRLWRGVVKDIMRVAKCVRVKVCERQVRP